MEPTRRDAAKAAALVAAAALAGEAAAEDKKEEKVASSGETVTETKTTQMTLDISKEKLKVKALAAGLNSFFSRISPDATPGRNILTISGLPAGTRVISVWMTEWAQGNNPHAGGAWFYTTSVQLYDNGTKCRVVFSLDWGGHLPAACQVIYGAG
jgi:hypothetical protein